MAPLLRLRALSLLIALPLAFSPAAQAGHPDRGEPVTRGTATQTVELQAGWNWVGLRVLPPSSSMAEVLAPVLSHVVVVKDDAGNHFVPSHGVNDLATWAWDRGYMVNVSAPVSLPIPGMVINAGASPLALQAGWNLIPFLGETETPAEEVFGPIAHALVLARDADGHVFRPGLPSSTLTALTPGAAYQVFLNSPATLTFGSDSPLPSLSVPTYAALLALPTGGIELGESVLVEGYHAPGDGGGGVFRLGDVEEYTCDGALVLCPLDQLGAEVTDVTTFASSQSVRQYTVSQFPVAIGTLTLTLTGTNAGGQPWEMTIPDAYMHGTTYLNRDAWRRTFAHESGRFYENRDPGGRPIGAFLSRHLGSGWSVQATFRYRPIAGSLRWVRSHNASGAALPPQGQVWEARWFGCRAHDEAPYFDNTNCLNWGMALATHVNAASPGRVAEVRLTSDTPGSGDVFYYFKSIQVAEGVALSGSAGAHVINAVDDFGNAFRPVRPRPDAIVLRVLPEAAEGCTGCGHVLNTLDMRRPFDDPHHLPPAPANLLGNTYTAIHPENGASTWAVRDLVIDGNLANQDIWASRFTHDHRETHLRNAPGYAGIAQTVHGGKNVSGQRLTIERAYVTGYGAAAILTAIQADTTFLRDVSAGDVAYNHAGYLLSAIDAVNLGAHGHAWGHFEIYGGRIRNLVAENLSPGRSGANAVFSWRGGDYPTVESCPNRPCGTVVEGLYADMRGGDRNYPVQGLGPGITIRDATFIQREDGSIHLWQESGNGYQSSRYHDVQFENVRFHLTRTGGGDMMIRSHNLNRSFVRDIQIASAVQGARWNNLFRLNGSGRTGGTEGPYQMVYDSLGNPEIPLPAEDLARAWLASETVTNQYFILNSYLGTHGIIRGYTGASQGTGRLSSACEGNSVCAKIERAQLYLRDTELRAGTNRYSDGELFFEMARFHNVTDPSTGATSEAAGSFTCTGAATYTIPTNLYWRPHATRGRFHVSGGPAVAEVEYVDASGAVVGPSYIPGASVRDARQPQARITFASACPAGTSVSWDAAVSEWRDETGASVAVPEWYPHAQPQRGVAGR